MTNRIDATDDVIDIGALLPHRDSMLLVDRITEVTPMRVVGEHEVTEDAFWARGHFPGQPVLPGVLQIEFAAQLAAILFAGPGPSEEADPTDPSEGPDPTVEHPIGVLAVVRRCSFRRLVTPPATLVGTVVGTVVAEGVGARTRRAGTFDFRIESSRAVVSDGSVTLALTGPRPTTGGPNQCKESLP
jgi:3-hydroxymyristoyl/3-hydroxydecanoyl-(acyl carrier protein) dehydratase